MASNGRIYQAIEQFFSDEDWLFSRLDDEPVIQLRVAGESGTWTALAQAREEESQLVVYSLYPKPVPEENRVAMSELITRINYGLVLCTFELDLDNGDLRLRSAIDVEGEDLLAGLIRQIVHANIIVMDKYLPALAIVTAGALSAKEALKLVGD